ncbi:MAG: hypothetical protein KIT50_12200 [Bacteroidetes bacterium]|nr:hypothetical protein [Bacteroidota bacterium]
MPKTSSSTSKSKSPLNTALATVPATFRDKIVQSYLDLKQRHKEARYDSAGLAAGKFCESVLRLLQQLLTGSYTPFGQQIQNFADECRKLVQVPKTVGNESQRTILPRAIVFLYTLRNKRGIGHVGGDVDANPIDSVTIARTADWIMCELIRIHHGLSLEEAQAIVDTISARDIPTIWEVAGKKRVLQKGLEYKEQVLLLLYQDTQNGVLVEDLFDWTEYSNPVTFKKSVLQPLHDQRVIEYDKESEIVYISPVGNKEVEDKILKKIGS